MAKMSLPQLKEYVASVVTASKLSNGTFTATYNNIVGLLDKIGKIITLDTNLAIDKLAEFEGEYLSFGKTIEEWQQDLIMVQDYDGTGAGALAPHDPTYRPNFYSYTVGKKVIKSTIRNNDIERAVHFVEQFNEIVALQYKRLTDSMAQYRYGVKREMLGKFVGLIEGANSTSGSNLWNSATARTEGTLVYYVDSSSVNHFGIVVKAYASSDNKTWEEAIAGGWVIEYDLISTLAKPVDTQTGEAFIKDVKRVVEKALDVSEGNSLNGNTLGAVEGLVLIVKQGVMPNLDVDTMAGAFHLDKVSVPARVIVVRDFGKETDDKCYGILMDQRAMRLHNTYRATRENLNGDGDFLNLFLHTEDTAWISRNAFVHIFKTA